MLYQFFHRKVAGLVLIGWNTAVLRRHVPWEPTGTNHPRLRSCGLLPSWPDHEAELWPSTYDDMLQLGLHVDMHADSWTQGGDVCGMPPLFECTTDRDCQMAVVGSIQEVGMKCMHAVCMVTEINGGPWVPPIRNKNQVHADTAEAPGSLLGPYA